MITDASRRIQQARTALVLEQPFFGVLALRLRMVEDPSCETAYTDGVRIGYSPDFVGTLTQQELVGLLVHEVLHVANGHVWRRDGRDGHRWNVACDYAINDIIQKSGFTLPQGGLLDAQYAGKSAEWVYARLPEQPPQGGKDGKEKGGPARPGAGADDVRDAPTDAAEQGATEADWQQAVQQAANAAKAVGKLPSALDRFAKAAAQSRVDWRSILHRFVQQIAADDYSWTRPNRRYLPQGLYLPSLRSETLGPIAIAIDTSGSVDQTTINAFAAEVNAVVSETRPTRVYVLYADAKVHRIDTFEAGEAIELKPVGGGGTDFRDVFVKIEEFDEPVACVVYLTDGYGQFPESAEVPALWALTSNVQPPFGESVSLENV